MVERRPGDNRKSNNGSIADGIGIPMTVYFRLKWLSREENALSVRGEERKEERGWEQKWK